MYYFKPKTLFATAIFLCLPFSSFAGVVDKAVSKNISTTTGVITFLTSQESFSGGLYAIDRQDQTQSTFSTFKLPYRKNYDRHEDGSEWSMVMGLGRFDMEQDYFFDSLRASSRWQANSLSAGIGYSNWLNEETRWFANTEVIYTQIEHKYNIPSNQNQQATQQKSDLGDIRFSWQTDTLSFVPSIGLKYPLTNMSHSPPKEGWTYEPKLTYLFTKSIFERSEIESVTANSLLLTNLIDFGEPTGLKFADWSVGVNPKISRTDVAGAIEDGLASSHWYELQLNFVLHGNEEHWWDGLEYGFSYLQGDRFRGGQFLFDLSLSN